MFCAYGVAKSLDLVALVDPVNNQSFDSLICWQVMYIKFSHITRAHSGVIFIEGCKIVKQPLAFKCIAEK